MSRSLNRLACALALTQCVLSITLSAQQQAVTPSVGDTPAAKPLAVPGCTVDTAAPSAADNALYAQKYTAAEQLYSASLAADPSAGAAMVGIVRAKLGAGDEAGALALALKDTAAHPDDAGLMDALGEVRFRRGEIDEAAIAFNRAASFDHCSGRVHYDMSRFLLFSGMGLSAQRQLDLAHALSPADREIARRWSSSHATPLTSDQRLALLQKQLENPALNDAQRATIQRSIKTIHAGDEGTCQLVSPAGDAKLPLMPISTVERSDVVYGVGIEVQINGRKRRLQVDTGASGLFLTSDAAKAAGLVPEFESQVGGIGDQGASHAFVTHIGDIRIGSMEFRNCRATVLEPGNPLEKAPEIDGLVGTDVFQNYLVTLDFSARQLRIGSLPPRPGEQASSGGALATLAGIRTASIAESARDRYIAPEMKDWTPVFREGHQLIVPTIIGKAPTKLFVLDSGSSQTMISLDAGREVALLSGLTAPTIRGLSGETQKVLVADKINLWFAGVGQIIGGMTAIDTTKISRSVGVDIAGFIGFPTLNQLVVAIDYRDNLVHVVYNGGKGRR